MDSDTDNAILEFVLKESAELERQRIEMLQEERRRVIAQQDEEYETSLELDRQRVQERVNAEPIGEVVGEVTEEPIGEVTEEPVGEVTEDEPKEGDIKALREARLKYFKNKLI